MLNLKKKKKERKVCLQVFFWVIVYDFILIVTESYLVTYNRFIFKK